MLASERLLARRVFFFLRPGDRIGEREGGGAGDICVYSFSPENSVRYARPQAGGLAGSTTPPDTIRAPNSGEELKKNSH